MAKGKFLSSGHRGQGKVGFIDAFHSARLLFKIHAYLFAFPSIIPALPWVLDVIRGVAS